VQHPDGWLLVEVPLASGNTLCGASPHCNNIEPNAKDKKMPHIKAMICRKCLLHILESVLYDSTTLESCFASKLYGEATLLRVLVMFDKKGVASSINKVL
jgi:hypothetical protein